MSERVIWVHVAKVTHLSSSLHRHRCVDGDHFLSLDQVSTLDICPECVVTGKSSVSSNGHFVGYVSVGVVGGRRERLGVCVCEAVKERVRERE